MAHIQRGTLRLDETAFYMRHPRLVVMTSGSEVVFIAKDGAVIRHPTHHPGAWSRFLQGLVAPLPGRAFGDFARTVPDLTPEVLERLLEGDCILRDDAAARLIEQQEEVYENAPGFHLAPCERTCDNLVVACSGSVVSGLMAPTLLSLRQTGFQGRLDVILTESATKFVTREFLEAYDIRTWVEVSERKGGLHVPHVQLAQAASCIVVAPATASSLHRIANATCTDLLSLAVVATRAPVLLVPAMNDAMWENSAVQRNLSLLRKDGRFVVEPSLIFGASDFASQRRKAMYGGPGILWTGPLGMMRAIRAVLASSTVTTTSPRPSA